MIRLWFEFEWWVELIEFGGLLGGGVEGREGVCFIGVIFVERESEELRNEGRRERIENKFKNMLRRFLWK